MRYEFRPSGVCSRYYTFEIVDNKVESVEIEGGCNGNLKGIASLLKGMEIDEVIARLENIDCNHKGTSCPDQIAKALIEYKKNHQ